MDSMLAAIKARRSPAQGMDMPGADMSANKQDAGALKDLVAQLSPEQKEELMMLLVEQAEEVSTDKILKGAQSSGEKAALSAALDEDMGDQGEASDDVQMSLIDRQDFQKADQMEQGKRKPIGLAERAKMNAASKLKAKGKVK